MITSASKIVAPLTPKMLRASGWTHSPASNFLSHVGPVWMKMEAGQCRFGFVVEDKHDNTQGRAHGGMIMTFCDDAMGNAARAASGAEKLFTISFECQFISGAAQGEFAEVECEVVRSTRSLVFMRSTCFVGDRVVATAGGIWKVLSR